MSLHQESARVNVRILDKDYLVACAHEERSALLDAAEYLSSRMREVRDSGKLVGTDRIAVMVALNLANELLQLKSGQAQLENEVEGRLRSLRERLEGALENGPQLTL